MNTAKNNQLTRAFEFLSGLIQQRGLSQDGITTAFETAADLVNTDTDIARAHCLEKHGKEDAAFNDVSFIQKVGAILDAMKAGVVNALKPAVTVVARNMPTQQGLQATLLMNPAPTALPTAPSPSAGSRRRAKELLQRIQLG